jgi:hypothetical protein
LLRSLKGYLRFFRGILWLFIALGLIAVSGFIIVYPLWYFAAGHRNLYTIFSAGLLLLAAVYVLFRKLRRAVRGAGGPGPYVRTRFFKKAKKLLFLFLAVLALYGIILLFIRGWFLAASGTSLIYVILLGVVLAGRSESV